MRPKVALLFFQIKYHNSYLFFGWPNATRITVMTQIIKSPKSSIIADDLIITPKYTNIIWRDKAHRQLLFIFLRTYAIKESNSTT